MISKMDNFGFFSKACIHLLAEDIAVTFLLIIVMFAKMDTFWFVSKAQATLSILIEETHILINTAAKK